MINWHRNVFIGTTITQLTQWIESMRPVKENHPASQLLRYPNHIRKGCIGKNLI